MGERPDQLREEVDRKRDDAARKIDEIEQRVAGTAQRVQDGVTQTTEQVKATVQDSIQGAQQAVGETAQQLTEQVKATTQQVTEQVKATVDWRKQVEERPLVMAGAAFLGGFVLGSLTGGGDGHGRPGYRGPDTPGYSYGGPLYGNQMGMGGQRSYQSAEGQGMGASGATQALGGAGLMASLRGIVQQSGLQDTLVNSASALVSSAGDRIRFDARGAGAGLCRAAAEATRPGRTDGAAELAGSVGPRRVGRDVGCGWIAGRQRATDRGRHERRDRPDRALLRRPGGTHRSKPLAGHPRLRSVAPDRPPSQGRDVSPSVPTNSR